MSEWVTLHVYGMPSQTRLSAAVFSPGALRDIKTWFWFGAVAFTGLGSWWGLMRLAFFANAMHRRSVATMVLFITLLMALAAAGFVGHALDYLLPDG